MSGFTLRQASPQWAPPTDYQEGLIGPHWSKGWIIENNIISESKCVGISLGTEIGTGHSNSLEKRSKGGTQREQEVILRALRSGWHKDNIGDHIVRGNVIHDCEQAGIVGIWEQPSAAFTRIGFIIFITNGSDTVPKSRELNCMLHLILKLTKM